MLSPFFHDAFDPFAFIEALNGLSDASAVSDALHAMFAQFGFKGFVLSELPVRDQKFVEAIVTVRLPSEWLQIYNKEDYHRVDPILSHARRCGQPIEWRDMRYDAERLPRADELMGRRREFGFCNGFVVPIPDVCGSPAFMSAAGPDPELSARSKAAIHLMAFYALDRLPLTSRGPGAHQGFAYRAGAGSFDLGSPRQVGVGNRGNPEYRQAHG